MGLFDLTLTLQMVFKSNLSCKIFYQLKKKQTKYEMPYCLYHFVLYIVHVCDKLKKVSYICTCDINHILRLVAMGL
jgi:hypothetical protein